MDQAEYKPAGYCPKCGYAMDAGRCPECGAYVIEAHLAKLPPRIILRRRLRRAVFLICAAAIPYGAYRFYCDVNWLSWLPGWVLVKLQTADWDRADNEIYRRYATGGFSKTQLDQLHESVFDVSPIHRENWPSDTPMPFGVRITTFPPFKPGLGSGATKIPLGGLTRGDWSVSVDGRQRLTLSGRPEDFFCAYPSYEVWCDLEGLPPGTHTIAVKGDIWFQNHPISQIPTGISWPVNVISTVTIVDRHLETFIRRVWDDFIGEQVSQSTGIHGYRRCFKKESTDLTLSFYFRPPTVPLAFEVHARPSGEKVYQIVRGSFGRPESLIVQSGRNRMFGFGPSGLRLPEGCTSIDVQLRPSLSEAYLNELGECFGGILEWTNLPLTTVGDETFGMSLGIDDPWVAPSRVFKLQSETAEGR